MLAVLDLRLPSISGLADVLAGQHELVISLSSGKEDFHKPTEAPRGASGFFGSSSRQKGEPPGSSWLLLAPPGSSWLFLALPGSSWLHLDFSWGFS